MLRSVPTAVVVVCLALVACGEESPTAPSTPQIPQVAGTYTGSLTLTALATGQRIPGSARMVVRQAGSQLTISGSITMLGLTTQITAVTGTINATGYFSLTSGGFTGTVDAGECGRLRPLNASLTFAGSTAEYIENLSSTGCGNFQVTASLTR